MNQEVVRLEALLARVQKNAALPRPLRAVPAPLGATAAPAAVAFAAPVASAPPPPPAMALSHAPMVIPAPEFPIPDSLSPPPFIDSVDDLLADPFPASSAPPPPPVEERASVVESIETPEELLEDDIVEMSPTAAPYAVVMPEPSHFADELNFEDEEAPPEAELAVSEEAPPVSSSRAVAGSMDEALARAAAQLDFDEGREVPLKTPPPASGQQVAPPALLTAELDELLEADILPGVGSSAPRPTTEQLGQTIDLEEARGPHLELDHPGVAAPWSTPEELEVTLPQREFGGGYQADLMPPPEAREDLDAHRRRASEAAIALPPESLADYPGARPVAAFTTSSAPAVSIESPADSVSAVTPELLARPELSRTPIAKFLRAESPRPCTFLELLDSSLALGRD